jgi:hypothetical protein
MSATLSPIVSEFETQEAADAYDVWFRAKVTKSMNSNKPLIPHDQVKAEMQEMLDDLRKSSSEH